MVSTMPADVAAPVRRRRSRRPAAARRDLRPVADAAGVGGHRGGRPRGQRPADAAVPGVRTGRTIHRAARAARARWRPRSDSLRRWGYGPVWRLAVWLVTLTAVRCPGAPATERADAARGRVDPGRCGGVRQGPARARGGARAGGLATLLVHLLSPAAMGAGDVKLALGLGALAGAFGVDAWVLAALGAPLLTAVWGLLERPARIAAARPGDVRGHRGRRLAGDFGALTGAERTGTHRSRTDLDSEAPHGRMGHVLRWTTAGESHGRALVAVVEGMVAGVAVTSDDIAEQLAPTPSGLRPRRADEVRAGPGDHARRCAARQHAGRPDRRRDRQHRMAQVGDRDGPRPGRPPTRARTSRATRR